MERRGGGTKKYVCSPATHPHQRRRPAVVEQAEDVNGVQPLGGGQQGQGHRRDGPGGDGEAQGDGLGGQVQPGRQHLRSRNGPAARRPAQGPVQPDVAGRVDQGSRRPADAGVVALALLLCEKERTEMEGGENEDGEN